MTPPRALRRPRRTLLVAAVLALAAVGAACAPEPPPPPPPPPDACDAPVTSSAVAVTVMGPCARLTVDQIVAWFETYPGRPTYRATVPIRDLVTYYVLEGMAEGVRGDIAMMQGIVETGWFSFPGVAEPWTNNFAGIGAVDSNPGARATFPDARTGVQAQIKHLRAYADPNATCAAPCVSPRFHLVQPKGKAPTWNQFGNGNWATDPVYSYKIVGQTGDPFKGLYTRMLEKYGLGLA